MNPFDTVIKVFTSPFKRLALRNRDRGIDHEDRNIFICAVTVVV